MKKSFFLFLMISLLFSNCKNDDDSDQKLIELPMELNFSGSMMGCGDFSVTQLLESGNSNISLTISTSESNGLKKLNLISDYQTFSLPNDNLSSKIRVWDLPVNDYFCNDVIVGDIPQEIDSWQATSGVLKIKVSNIKETEFETLYDISILLENVTFENNTNEKRIITNLTIEKISVGWYSG